MRLRYDSQTEAFRAELRAWIEANRPSSEEMAAEPRLSSGHLPGWARAWQRRLYDAGWLVPGWPPEFGGRNASPEQQMVYFEELARTDLSRAYNPQGLGIVAPSLVDHGSDEQKERYLLPTLRGEIAWCVGMSEPEAGSDLAGLKTRAAIDGDEFVVDGQKVWTSGAHHADVCLCFVRTDQDAPKHRGISALIVDMRSPGISCRPLPELTDPDYADFDEVFFEGVRVPCENLVGELNGGWAMAVGSLGHERAMLWVMQATAIERNLERLRALGDEPGPDGKRRGDDARFRDLFAGLYVDAQALWLLGYKGFAKATSGEVAPEHLILKLYGSELEQRLYLAGLEACGADGLDVRSESGAGDYGMGPWAVQYLRSFAQTIAGGTSEIQRNIVAERVLGLPRE